MLRIVIPETEFWDEGKCEFIKIKAQTLQLEHSLVSISKWESKWCKPFLSTKEMTNEETIDYIKCMTLTTNVKPETYDALTADNIEDIKNYISAPMTATTFTEDKNSKNSREIVTSELIYYWMSSLNINMKCEKWHLNRLLTLIRVHNVKNAPAKKRSRGDTSRHYAELNAARRKKYNTKG